MLGVGPASSYLVYQRCPQENWLEFHFAPTLSSKYSIWSNESIGISKGTPIYDASCKDPIDWKSEVPDPSELYSAVNLEILTKSELRVGMHKSSIRATLS